MFTPFAGEEVRPVGGGGDGFAFWRGELEEDGKAAFAEGGMFRDIPAFL